MPHPAVPAHIRWAELVDKLNRSDLTLAEFAASNGLNPGTLKWWRTRIKRRQSATAGFVEVAVEAPSAAPLRLHLGDRPCVLEVDHRSDLRLVRRLVEALC